MYRTRVTSKYQTTIPREIRKRLGVKAGSEVGWHTVREFVMVDAHKAIKNPVAFLTSQIREGADAVKLVRRAREEFG